MCVRFKTEELHRKAYNRAFYEAGVKVVTSRAVAGNSNLAISEDPVVWSVEYYDILQNSVGGGKPKMRHYFKEVLNNIFHPCVSLNIIFDQYILIPKVDEFILFRGPLANM